MSIWQNLRRNSGLADDPAWRRFVVRWSLVSLLLIAIAAYNSYGFYQFDEHYQVVELVGYKLGKTPASELAWEFRAQIRPWLQPGMYYVAAKALIAVGVENPFKLATAFRAISGLFGWLAIGSLMLSANVFFGAGQARRLAVILLATLWLIPYLAVRTSGESLSSDFLAFGIALLVLGSTASTSDESQGATRRGLRNFSPLTALLAGILFGLAFEFRFQIAFAVIGVVGWVMYTSSGSIRRRIGLFTLISCGVAAAVILGTVVDRWGYGNWTIVPWNYFHKDIVEGRPNLDGTDPIWAYITKLIANPLAPITWLWITAMVVMWIRHPRHIVTWTTLPFFVVHSLVPHKELRYIFPIALLATFSFVLAFVPDANSQPQPTWLNTIWERRHSVFAKTLVAFNAVALIYACFVAREPSLNFQHYIVDHYPNGCTMYVLGEQTRSPFENVGATMFFYRPPNFTCKRLKTDEQLATALRRNAGEILVLRDRLANWSPPDDAPAADVQLIYNTYPAWVEHFNWGNWLSNSKRFALYAIRPLHSESVASQSAQQSAVER